MCSAGQWTLPDASPCEHVSFCSVACQRVLGKQETCARGLLMSATGMAHWTGTEALRAPGTHSETETETNKLLNNARTPATIIRDNI